MRSVTSLTVALLVLFALPAVGVDVFNITNRVNCGSYIGTIGSPLFLQPTSARPARQVQLSARVKF